MLDWVTVQFARTCFIVCDGVWSCTSSPQEAVVGKGWHIEILVHGLEETSASVKNVHHIPLPHAIYGVEDYLAVVNGFVSLYFICGQVPCPFPCCTTRQIVCRRRVKLLSPIECSIDDIGDRIETMRDEVQAGIDRYSDSRGLTRLVQGSVLPQVRTSLKRFIFSMVPVCRVVDVVDVTMRVCLSFIRVISPRCGPVQFRNAQRVFH